ncbi:MAG: Lrp/AsnC family transcriptional regulator, leucine-responsive regulatory protein [Candidatus Binatota bacterium]|jgi:Lrp/AsnC family leucine-responsive transcriptional regulator|nr:Lrp/AsnC family transcriptional regulator, leucine-responsive regulatory protein [Candidatus Binatota bacterium]
MKFGNTPFEPDDIDLGILTMLQENCRTSLARIGEQVGLSPPSVNERIHKLEESGVLRGYHAAVDARLLGFDITAFIGVSINHPTLIQRFEAEVEAVDDVLECHHVTGSYSLLLKVKTENTSSLEQLISRIRSIEGVERTETMVVLSTHTERSQLGLSRERGGTGRKARRNGDRPAVALRS